MLIYKPVRQSVVGLERKRPLPPAIAGCLERSQLAISGAGRMRETRLQSFGRITPQSPRSAELFEMRDASLWGSELLFAAAVGAFR